MSFSDCTKTRKNIRLGATEMRAPRGLKSMHEGQSLPQTGSMLSVTVKISIKLV